MLAKVVTSSQESLPGTACRAPTKANQEQLAGFASGRRRSRSWRGRRRHGHFAVECEGVEAAFARASGEDGNVLLSVEHVGNGIRESRRQRHPPELFAFIGAEGFEVACVGSGEDEIAGGCHRAAATGCGSAPAFRFRGGIPREK